MDAIINLPQFIWEFISRRDFIGAYLFLIALNLLWFAMRGLLSQQTRGFGAGSRAVTGQNAVKAGWVWLATGAVLVTLGGALWQSA